MPVSVITDVITWIEMIAQIGVAGVELGVLTYLVYDNGWLDMIRKICFWLDKLIIQYVDKFYSYFDKILNGTIFSPTVVERVMNGVYLFVTVLVLFKLIMLLMKYITNPDAVSDDKIGASSLVKRVIIGMCLMLFLNSIFTMGYKLQSAILTDNLFGQILLTRSQLRTYEKNKDQMGRVLAFNVYQGFWNLDKNQVASTSLQNKYKNAVSARDPGVFGDINEKSGGDYAIDYFPVLSTVVVGYVLYLVIKYCIDVVVRMFKLFLLQMLGPLAITDYMINGDSKEMFKSWVKTTISAYLMLFIRIFSIWFVAFITILMNEKCTTVKNGVCADSLLYVIDGQDPDYLLKALITLGLLAFLMELPKLLSTVFGLDLEQDSSVKGLMGKVGGIGKMLGTGALAAGGAAIGGAIGGMKNMASATKQHSLNSLANKGKLDAKIASGNSPQAQRMRELMQDPRANRKEISKLRNEHIKQNPKSSDVKEYKHAQSASHKAYTSQMARGSAGGAHGLFTGAANNTPGLRNFSSGLQQASGSMERVSSNISRSASETQGTNNAYLSGIQSAWNQARSERVIGNDDNHGTNISEIQDDSSSQAVSDFSNGVTTFGRNREDETELQTLINDAANVHQPLSASELANQINDSAFANVSDDAFNEYQARGGVIPQNRGSATDNASNSRE